MPGKARDEVSYPKTKVAIIDNGVDVRQEVVFRYITNGMSFVKDSDDWPMPWFTAQDLHGTQMARLVSQVNPYCELYIYRINVMRNDIRLDAAVQVWLKLHCHTQLPGSW